MWTRSVYKRVAQSAWVKSGRDETIKNLRGVFPRLWRDNALVQASFTERQSWPLPRIVTRKGRACGAFTFPPTVPLKKKKKKNRALRCCFVCRLTALHDRKFSSRPVYIRSTLLTPNDKADSSSAPKQYFDSHLPNLDCFSMIPFQITVSLLLFQALLEIWWAQISGDSTLHIFRTRKYTVRCFRISYEKWMFLNKCWWYGNFRIGRGGMRKLGSGFP